MTIKVSETRHYLLFLIVLLIGFQQFPVLRIGGSFKLYEILSIILLLVNVLSFKRSFSKSYINIFAFCFFVLSPLISILAAYFIVGYPKAFYEYYLGTDSIKFNYYIFPILQVFWMFFNYSTFSSLINSVGFYLNFEKILKAIVIMGSIIAVYSIIAMFTVDVITLLPTYIQFKRPYYLRSSGLSQEPGGYVLYQAWVCLITFYSGKLFSKVTWIFLVILNTISLIFTFSTTLIAFFGIVFLAIFILRTTTTVKLVSIISFILLVSLIYVLVVETNNVWYFNTFFVDKINNFFEPSHHTLDSGSFRSYTSKIGIEIFKDNVLFGVGVGNSIYHMFPFEFKMGIEIFGERLHPGSFPQNLFSIVLSEQGLIGFIPFLLLFFSLFFKFFFSRNKSRLHQMFFIGALFNLFTFLSVSPQYSLFIWLFLGLGIGYLNYFDSTVSEQVCKSEKTSYQM